MQSWLVWISLRVPETSSLRILDTSLASLRILMIPDFIFGKYRYKEVTYFIKKIRLRDLDAI